MNSLEIRMLERSTGNDLARRGQLLSQTGWVLGLALLLRVFAAWGSLRHSPKGWFSSRGLEMSFMADSLAHGHGLSSPFGGMTGPTAMFAPIYPSLIAVIFRLFGSSTVGSAVAIMAVQIAVNLLIIWLIMHIARTQFSDNAGLIAGIFWTFSPPLWWLPTIFWDTTITICLLTGLVALGLWVEKGPTLPRWLAFGAYCGLTGLFNPALMPTLLVVFAGLALICWRKGAISAGFRLKRAGLGAVVFLLVFSVWPIRNARVMHAFVPLRTAPGLDLWMGNHPGASGYLEEAQFPIYDRQEFDTYVRVGEIAYTRAKEQAALGYIRAEPGIFVRMTLRRVGRFWLGMGSREGSPVSILHAAGTLLLGAMGLWMLVRRRRWSLVVLLATPLILFPVPYYVTHAEFRFRLVIDPLLTMLAAYAVVEVARVRASRREADVMLKGEVVQAG